MEFHNILFIRSGGIGDVLMSTPLVRAVRKRFPHAAITYLVGNWSREALAGNKNIDKIIPFHEEIIFKKHLFPVIRLIKNIRKEKFDLCFVLDKSWLWSFFAFLCRIQERVGFSRSFRGFNTKKIPFEGRKYELDYYLDLLQFFDAGVDGRQMDLCIPQKDQNFAKKIVGKLKVRRIIGIAPGGAENPGQKTEIKRWPLENYIALIKALIEDYGVILFGGKNDTAMGNAIVHAIKDRNLINTVGKVSISQTAALMKKCHLIVTHDSGPMHIAAASGSKVVALFGPTPAERFAPKDALLIKSKAAGCPCYDIHGNFRDGSQCMKAITVEEVLLTVKKMLT